MIGDEPDGRNINLRLRLDPSRARSRSWSSRRGCQLGVAFDGDGDRAIFVDSARAGRQRRRGAADVRAASCSARAG